MSREKRSRKLKPRIFFFVEGKTEKVFFDALSQHYRLIAAKTVKIIDASGSDWVDKVANMMKNNPKLRPDEKTQVYIIFDRDDLSVEIVSKMQRKAKKMAIRIADCQLGFSNRSFEVWLLAHYRKMTVRVEDTRHLCAELSQFWGYVYVKGDSQQMESILKDDKVFQAIDNTQTLTSLSIDKQSTNIGTIVSTVIS
ncbi:RloB family protein [Lactiplantibacillus sp. WILCCON 0030]|uniref:RloB family protein n=1 Tax=Lactiplantibacillus brownii TaxID=3069269 RepID=A0ABU1A7U4_9LACO|nr:RloB family protein [Lactiplantibacillus brownii]MDQ7937017.1 RloB family protein [Lactiplantibacillus brownii]